MSNPPRKCFVFSTASISGNALGPLNHPPSLARGQTNASPPATSCSNIEARSRAFLFFILNSRDNKIARSRSAARDTSLEFGWFHVGPDRVRVWFYDATAVAENPCVLRGVARRVTALHARGRATCRAPPGN